MKKLILILTIFMIGLFQVSYSKTGIQIGNKLPNFEYYNLMGGKMDSKDLEGKAIMLNFWATWCPPCRQEMPSIEKLYKKYKKNSNFEIVAISVDQGTSIKVANFIKENKYTFPVYFDEKGKLGRKFLIRSIPTTFIINSEGIIIDKKLGAEDWSKLKIESLIINKEAKKGDEK